MSIRKYKKDECITFKSTKGHYGSLSNMAPNYPIHINGTILRTTEALYQALRFPNYPEIQKEIIQYASPISAKKFGRRHLNKTRSDWNQIRFKVMKFCIELKLYQNYDIFSKMLLATKDLPIVEYTDKDKVWGATLEGEYYVGTNALGRLLMELREKVKNDKFELIIPEIENFRFLSQIIDKNSVPNNVYKK
ncbi:NADAR family protein [Pontimicrobium aquaticum]|uniref:NADAR family protein n=1 Tax=Pontimicrobium aquaticum TaxID=2565367 RepID=UPI00145D97BD|nr:NADAR family protein [Pontimicrobium aquaticum]